MKFDYIGFEKFRETLSECEILDDSLIQPSVYKAIIVYYNGHNTTLGADARKAEFVKKIRADTNYSHGIGGEDRQASPSTVRSYLDKLKQGEVDSFWPILVYYWFLTVEESRQNRGRKYLDLIENKLYADFDGEKTFQGFFGKPVPGTETVGEAPIAERPLITNDAKPTGWQPPEYHPPTQFSDDQWLSPENPNGIPFVARDDEIKRLDAFASDKKRMFQIWAVIAPSGAGKTRLILEWIRDPDKLQGWRKCVIKAHHKDDAGWQDWQPDKPTLLVIDYISGFETFIRALIDRFSGKEQAPLHPVKLLVLDHIFPEDFGKITELPRWGLSDLSGTATDRVGEHFFDQAPMLLDKTDDLERIIHGVIARVSGKNDDDQNVKDAADYLRKEKGAWHPLFAALVGFALSKQEAFSDYSKWNRLELIHYYLNGADRLPWRHESPDSIWASCFIVVATLRRGVKIDLLMEYVPVEGRLAATSRKAILDLCNPVISSPDRLNLPPFEPDILGESFFLLFLKHCLEPANRGHFMQMLSGGEMPLQINDAGEFIGVMQRLARNLSNDNQEADETKAYWERLENFLTPDRFPAESPFRWAVAIACFKISQILRDKKHTTLAKQFLSQVNADDLYAPPPGKLWAAHIFSVLRYFEASREGSDTVPPLLATLLASYDPQNSGDATALMMASQVGSLPVVDYLIDMGADVDAADGKGMTALMLACDFGHEAVALRLVEACEKPDAANAEGWTALMSVCFRGQAAVVYSLIEKCENLDAINNAGSTALMLACGWKNKAVALKMAEKCIDTDAADDKGQTALMFACMFDHEEAALKLIEKCDNLDAADDRGRTALMFACRDGPEATALRLAERCESFDAVNDKGQTALMFACHYEHEATALKLIGRGAGINHSDKCGRTVLMQACGANLKGVVHSLIDRHVQLDDVCRHGGVPLTALGFARNEGHQEIVEMLEEAGALELPPW